MRPRRRISSAGRSSRTSGAVYLLAIASDLLRLASCRPWGDHACRSAVIAGPCAWTGPGGPGPGPPSAVVPAGYDHDRRLGGRVPGGRRDPGHDRRSGLPSTKGYVHFQFSDYSKLTIIRVLIACAAWPIVTRISSAPRWLFIRLAVAVTLVLWLPDLYILHLGQPAQAVAVLMVMHLAIAVVTYNCLVRIAAIRSTRR